MTFTKLTLERFNLESNENVVNLYNDEVNKLMDFTNDYQLSDSKKEGFDTDALEVLLDIEYDTQE